MSKLREGNHERAWNDPPVFTYDTAAAAQATHKRTALSKRVAFPVSGGAGREAGAVLLPGRGPPPAAARPPGQQQQQQQQQLPAVHCLSAEEAKLKLTHLLDKLENVPEKVAEEIALRTEVLYRTWSDGRLSQPVRERVTRLIQALEADDVTAADRLQRALMVDYGGECSGWMVGPRQLIVHLQHRLAADTAEPPAGAERRADLTDPSSADHR